MRFLNVRFSRDRRDPDRTDSDPPESFACECGLVHLFPSVVYERWEVGVQHHCGCGRDHTVQRGVATLVRRVRRGPGGWKGRRRSFREKWWRHRAS